MKRSCVITFTIVALVFTQMSGFASTASAKWRDNSDQLPGTAGGGVTIALVVGAVVAVVSGLTYYFFKGRSKSKTSEGKNVSTPSPVRSAAVNSVPSERLEDSWFGIESLPVNDNISVVVASEMKPAERLAGRIHIPQRETYANVAAEGSALDTPFHQRCPASREVGGYASGERVEFLGVKDKLVYDESYITRVSTVLPGRFMQRCSATQELSFDAIRGHQFSEH